MKTKITATLVVIMAGAVVTGIALARPAANPAGPAAVADSVPEAQPPATGFLAGGSESPAPQDAAITIEGFSFGSALTVSAGTNVTVSNADGASHTLTADDGEFDTGQIEGSGSTAFVAPATPGTYTFFCAIHPSMTGQLVVAG